MHTGSRREVFAVLAGGLATLSGCSILDGADDGTPGDGQSTDIERTEWWPNRRGPPTHTGVSATGGPGPDAEQVTTAELRDGIAVSNRAPVVGDLAIYAIGGAASPYEQTPPEFACYAYALSPKDGSEIWRQRLEVGEGDENRLIGNEHNLCLGTDGLYVAWLGPTQERPVRVARLSRSDGGEQWRQTISPTGGTVYQPVVRDGRVYQQVNDRVIAFDTADGTWLWETPERLVAQFLPTVGEDVLLFYHRTPDEEYAFSLSAFDIADRSVRWTNSDIDARFPIPVIAGDTVYVTDGDSFGQIGVGALTQKPPSERDRRHVYALSLSDGSERWTHTYDTDDIHEAPTPGGTSYVTVTDEYVYYALGFPSATGMLGPDTEEAAIDAIRGELYRGPNVVALDRSDGSVAWRTKLGSLARVFQPMVADDDNLYALYRGVEAENEQSKVYVIDRESGDVRGSFGPVETTQPFAVAGGTLYTHREGAIQGWQ